MSEQNSELRAYSMLKHQLREARSSTVSITTLAKPVKYAIEEAINSEVVKVLNRLLVQQRICHDCIHDDEELGTIPYVSLSAIENEKSKYE